MKPKLYFFFDFKLYLNYNMCQGDFMYLLKDDLCPGTVVWANRNIYYDRPDEALYGKRSMYLITSLNTEYFFGCPLTTNFSRKNSTVLRKKFYPLRQDSRVNECLYKLEYNDIASSVTFKVSRGTFENFKRNLYKRIAIGAIDSPDEYNDIFVKEYLMYNKPEIGNILVYPSEEKVFKYYYICSNRGDSYTVIKLNEDNRNYEVASSEMMEIPKAIRFYDYYDTYNMDTYNQNRINDIVKMKKYSK